MVTAIKTQLPELNLINRLELGFVKVGVLAPLMAISIIVFSQLSDNFLTFSNLENVLRQNSFLVIVAMGQMLVLLTGGFDLSVGTLTALVSVVTATVMADTYGSAAGSVSLAIVLGVIVGVLTGAGSGLFNGIGVAIFNISPFIMTLGTSSIALGIALFITNGVPVRGMPAEFANIFGYADWFRIAVPTWITIVLVLVIWVLLNRTRLGRYLYAIGGNAKAAALSGVAVRTNLISAYVIASVLVAVSAALLTARLETGEANIGVSLPLQSIAACVLGGVSLRGGIGSVLNVVLGALFIGLVQNGMNLARVQSYVQMIVLGGLLILAVVVDRLRQHCLARLSAQGVIG